MLFTLVEGSKAIVFCGFGGDVGVDFDLVGVVVGEGGINLRQGQLPDAGDDFGGGESLLMPDGNAADCYTCACDERSAVVDFGI